jgi:hypothetical protein
MSLHRFEIQARLEDEMTEGRVGAGALQLVMVCLCDEGDVSDEFGEPIVSPPVLTHVRPSPVASRRVLSLCAGLWRGRPTRSVPRHPAGGSTVCGPWVWTRSGAVGGALIERVSHERVDDRRCCACHCHTDRVCRCRRGG